MCWSVVQGFFLDVPRVIDFSWRHLDYRVNAESKHKPGGIDPDTGTHAEEHIEPRRFWRRPAFWFFAITVFFTSYGPTWDGLCAVAPQSITRGIRQAIAVLIMAGAVELFRRAIGPVRFLIRERFAEARRNEGIVAPNDLPRARRYTCRIVIFGGLFGLALGTFLGGFFLFRTAPGDLVCALNEWNPTAILRAAMCLIAVGLFAWLTSFRPARGWFAAAPSSRLKFDALAQFLILAGVAAIQWFALTNEHSTTASDLPYRHVFLLWAPCIAAVVAAAPWWARARFQTVTPALRRHFQQLLPDKELFVHPTDPPLNGRSIFYGFLFAPVTHILHLLLFPALVAIAVPPDSLYWWVGGAFIFSLLLVVWGNMSPRWQELNIYIERWFLRGTPRLISLFVIGVAILRLVHFDYVSTLLDAIPFGTILSLVVMNYVLFWLAEYWMSRSAALELLGVLGAVRGGTYVYYGTSFDQLKYPDVRVDVNDRYLAMHATGRFIVLGDVLNPERACRAFQPYYLVDTFAAIDDDPDSKPVVEIAQRTGNYFAVLNLALIAVAAGFVLYSAAQHGETVIKPVVTESKTPPAPQLVDLASLLQPGTQQPARPAVVVVASGGGTRAALYTASVLRGLHRLNVDRDIVLASGVSGGGVALAYFAANSAALTGQGAPAASTPCPPTATVDQQWSCFTTNVTKPFIEDVVNGATEWRIFGSTALSQLLVESFQRYLFGKQPLGSIRAPALILNTTIVSHPAGESAVLTRTIKPAKTCDDEEQVFQMMSGGRLVFTNLQDVDAFGRDGPESELPDIRLPYLIVRDPDILVAQAAALNANFPPVFPAARVRVRDTESTSCPWRSFYVTDGGAEENLGLISALYALESALGKLKATGAHARPIHVVIAEASALDYDYTQDRGVSVLLGGSRERLAGGLTRELRKRVDDLVKKVNGGDAKVHYHFLPLPLAFRARGGFGTHWLYAQSFELTDPRPRTTARDSWTLLERSGDKVTIGRKGIEELWLALHDPQKPFCEAAGFSDRASGEIQEWICSPAQNGGRERDLHMPGWKTLVDELRTP